MKLPLVLLLVCLCAAAQAGDVLWPLPEHTTLTGGFADSRPDHFHGGVDVRTEGQHLPVVAPADGWIERIAVTPPGYGRTLYFRLPDGRTAVFAHLSRFVPMLENMLRDSQLVVGTYRVDILFDTPAPVRQFRRGDTLAFTGDTGIGPPHFHFELREGAVQIDPLRDFADRGSERPALLSLSWIGLSDYSPTAQGRALKAVKRDSVVDFGTIEANEPIAFFVRADMANSFGRRGAPAAVRVKQNGETLFEDFPTRIDLQGPRDIYKRIVLTGTGKNGYDLRRLFDSPEHGAHGWVTNADHEIVEMEVEDRAGEIARGRVVVTAGQFPDDVGRGQSPTKMMAGDFVLESDYDRALAWTTMTSTSEREVVIAPMGVGFEDRHVLRYDGKRAEGERLYFYEQTKRGRHPLSSTVCDSSGLRCHILRSGIYNVAVDSAPPRLLLQPRRDGLHFRLTDGESGIDDATIRCTVGDRTAIAEFEYEARGGTIWTREPLTRGAHHVHFTATDRAGNVGTWDQTVRIP
jgi:hypothetical protein